MPSITLDGRRVEAPPEATVLDVARAAGVDIPTLCHHAALGPYGACRLCVVEAEGPALRRSLVTSCTLPATDGLTVVTTSPAVLRARRMVLELLLGRSPESEKLRALALRYGVESSRFGSGQEAGRCVRCGQCVRACRDAIGTSAIAFAGRGQARHVTAEFGKLSEVCVGCGTCAAVCPSGAVRIEDRDGERTVVVDGAAVARLALLRCASCGAPAGTERFRQHVAARLRDLPSVDAEPWCPECARLRRAPPMSVALPAGRPSSQEP